MKKLFGVSALVLLLSGCYAAGPGYSYGYSDTYIYQPYGGSYYYGRPAYGPGYYHHHHAHRPPNHRPHPGHAHRTTGRIQATEGMEITVHRMEAIARVAVMVTAIAE